MRNGRKQHMMKVTWIGQAGLLINADGLIIMVDPYLSDSCGKVNPLSKRRLPVDESLFKTNPDVMIFTHNHLDHYDPETVEKFIHSDKKITVLSPQAVWSEVRKYGGANNYVLFNRHTEWTQGGIRFTAVKAEHSDPHPIGVIIDDGDKKLYITGDTLFNTDIFEDLPDDIFALFLPVNGKGNNMNMTDAARFAQKVSAEYTVPLHIGMFDDLKADDFNCKNKIIPHIYEEIIFN